ncbi:MAG: hypothetical protein OEZ47_10870 [Gammaproteobacteria bacterium]|nr:hypothetical protein [Gammaproteobacteria bacterium]
MSTFRAKVLAATALSTFLILAGCGGDSGSPEETQQDSPKIQGNVSLSGVVSGKPQFNGKPLAPTGYAGSSMYKSTSDGVSSKYNFLPSIAAKKGFANANVFLFDADHPEYKAPVAETTTDANGNYALDTLSNAAENGNAYTDGAKIPDGHYTLIASYISPTGSGSIVAVQSIAQDVEGSITGNDLEATSSSTVPAVTKMFGKAKNTDGTQTWGNATYELPLGAKIQVAFNMPMARDTVIGNDTTLPATVPGITVKQGATEIAGTWVMSPDWTVASFTPTTPLTGSTVYTVTVYGDDSGRTGVKNVYFNELEFEAVGTFRTAAAADTTAPTVTFNLTGTTESPTSTLTLTSNELLDTTGITLSLVPSLGSKPQVVFAGQSGGNYSYELTTAEPMDYGINYVGTITGLKDLSGNVATDIVVNYTTKSLTTGTTETNGDGSTLDLSDDINIAKLEATAVDVFNRWVAAMNNRDITKWLGLTAGNFAMDYNLANGFDFIDINRDGTYSMAEFSDALSGQIFPMWERCGVTLVGTIISDPANPSVKINVDVANEKVDFAFRLEGTATEGGQDCAEATPTDTLFTTLRKINGSMKVEHASIDIDTRKQSVGQLIALDLIGPEKDVVFNDSQNGPPAFKYNSTTDETNGGYTYSSGYSYSAGDPLKFQWTPVDGASAYVFIVMNVDDPMEGIALAMPGDSTVLDFSDPSVFPDEQAAGGATTSPNVMVSKDFGFHREFRAGPGAKLFWQIAALGSNTVAQIKNDTNSDLAKDVVAISELSRMLIAGANTRLTMSLVAQDGATGTTVSYDEFIQGFNITGVAGHTGVVDITFVSRSLTDYDDLAVTNGTAGPETTQNGGYVRVDGAFFQEYPVDFDPDSNASVVKTQETTVDVEGNSVTVYAYAVTQSINLTKGRNGIEITDHMIAGCPGCGPQWTPETRWARFNVITTAGQAPVIALTDANTNGLFEIQLTDATPTTTSVEGDAWNQFNNGLTPAVAAAKKATLSGTIAVGMTISNLQINLWNDNLQVFESTSIPVVSNAFSGTIKVYTGANWVNINGNVCGFNADPGDCRWATLNLGVYSDDGSVYVPPIAISSVADATDGANTLTATESFGLWSRWDASTITSNQLTITGTMINFNDPANSNNRPTWGAGGEGGWTGGDLSVDANGNFSVTIDLFNGYNNVHFGDTKQNWAGMEIFTSAGKPVIKPTITTVNGTAFTAPTNGGMGTASIGTCWATIQGTAKQGSVRINWRSEDDNGTPNNFMDDAFNWEEFEVKASGTPNAAGGYPFTVTVPVVGGTAKNFVDIMDKDWLWVGAQISTSDASCIYDVSNVQMTSHTNEQMLDLTGGTAATFDVSGTANRPGHTVEVTHWACGATTRYFTTSAMTENSVGSGLYDWTQTVDVVNGNQRVEVRNGWNQVGAINVGGNSGTDPVEVIKVNSVVEASVTGATIIQTNPTPPAQHCGQSGWDVGTATSITISGVTANPSTKLSVRTAAGFSEIVSDGTGAYSFDVALYNGYNRIEMNDANWNFYGMNVNTANGVVRPQHVDITSHTDNTVVGVTDPALSTTILVSGTIYADALNTGATENFTPHWFFASVWDTGGNSQNYSSDPNAEQWGDKPLNVVDNGDGTWSFSFNVTVYEDVGVANAGLATYINVYTGANGVDHGEAIGINTSSPGVWKPGASTNVDLTQSLREARNHQRIRAQQNNR